MRTIDINGNKYKSYDIIYLILTKHLKIEKKVILDLTYGKGRFYRRTRDIIELLVGVDIKRHEHEVEPDYFYLSDCRNTNRILEIARIHYPSIIIIDPPWNHEKRGSLPPLKGISDMPYHMKHISSSSIIAAAIKYKRTLRVPLIYKYKKPLEGTDILLRARVKIYGNEGYIYYGVIL